MVMQFEYPRNALLDLSPINDAIDFRAKQQQRAKDNAYRDEQLGMQKEEFGLKKQGMEDARQKAFVQKAAGIAQMISQEKDPAVASARWGQLVNSDPRWGNALKASGVDPNDFRTGAQMIIAEARGYQDPLDEKLKQSQLASQDIQRQKTQFDMDQARTNAPYEIDKTRAQIEATRAQAAAARAQAGEQYGFSGGYIYNKRTGDVRSAQPDGAPDLDREAKIRNEWTGQQGVKEFQIIRDQYGILKGAASNPSAAGDIATVFSFMKILDPNSVVREQEFATAQNAAGVPERVRNVFNRLLSGERLSPEQRADFLAQAENQYKVREGQYTALKDQYTGIARNARARPDQTVIDYGVAQPKPPPGSTNVPGVTTTPQGGQQPPQQQGQGQGQSQPPVPVQSAQDAMKLPPGTVFVTPDGRVKVRP